VKVTTASPEVAEAIPVCMPDQYPFFDENWHLDSLRRELEWDFDYYPDWDDPVWDAGNLCAGYQWADYDPLVLQPGEIFIITFQATVTLSVSGSYYNEVFVRIEDWWYGDWLYSWPTGGVTVPQYDLQAETLESILRASAKLEGDNKIRLRSYYWKRRR